MLKPLSKAARVGLAGFLCSVCIAAAGSAAVAPLQWGSVGPRAGGIISLAPAAGGAGVLWATTSELGVWKSIDGGASWVRMPLDLSYRAVVADPADPLVAYAGGSDGLAKTADGGATWQVVSTDAFGALAILPGAPRTLFLGSQAPGQWAQVSRSDDGGATWRPLGALHAGAEGIYELDVDPTNPESLFVMGSDFHVDTSPFFLHSADGGRTWGFAAAAPGGYATSLRFDPREPGTVYGLAKGPVRSRDGGATWLSLAAGLPQISAVFSSGLALDPASGAPYLTANVLTGVAARTMTGQVWTSADGGVTWTKLLERHGALYPLALDHTAPSHLYAGARDAGLLASTDGGRSWRTAGAAFLPEAAFELEPDPRTPGALYALVSSQLAQSGLASTLPDLARSLDGGATWQSWTPRDPQGAPVYLSRLVFDPSTPNSIYSDTGYALYHSADGGVTWSIRNSAPGLFPGTFVAPSSVVVDPHQAGVLFGVGPSLSGTEILRSTDGGLTWTTVFTLGSGEAYVDVLLADPAAPGTVYAGGHAGFWRTADGGQTWAALGAGLPAGPQFMVRLEIDGSGRLYAQLLPAGAHTLYRSVDGGAAWAPIDGGLPVGTLVQDLLARGTVLYAATDRGVFASDDGGVSWTAESDGLLSPSVSRLAAGPGGSLLAATAGGLAVAPPPGTCFASDTTLCLSGGRFALAVHWRRGNGAAGSQGDARAIPLTDGSGGFWFFSPESVELVVKMVDGRAVNAHSWVFAGALSDVAYTLAVKEVATGTTRTYENPRGHLASFADTAAFASPAAPAAPSASATPAISAAPPPPGATGRAAVSPCVPAADTLCLADSRFAVRVVWKLAGIDATSATAVPLFRDTGAFWFFDAGNPELVVKVLDGRGVNGRFWVFLAGLSSVDYTATLTDTESGAAKSYHHAPGALASSADTSF
jgi:photosystem II stability/assembly factor-like uncharacterized protein